MIYYISNHKSLPFYDQIVTSTMNDLLRYFKDHKFLQVDTETGGFNPHSKDLLLLQIGDKENQFVIDCTTVSLQPVKELLESRILFFHNGKFDLRFLFKQGIMPPRIIDTFLAERVISTGINIHRKSLAACCKRYCKITLPKDVRGQIHKLGPHNERVIVYAANDVKYLEEIWENQYLKLKELDLLKTIDLDNQFCEVLAYTEYCGVKLDKQKWKDKSFKDKAFLDQKLTELNNAVEELDLPEFLTSIDLFNPKPSCGINWNSSDQVVPLFKKLGIETKVIDKKTGEEKDSVESKIIAPQSTKHSIIKKYLDYQKAAKVVSTYGESFFRHITEETARIHTNFTQIMNTGRLSSGKEGGKKQSDPGEVNMQNIPRNHEHRSCFVPEEGNVFVVADYSSQESRVLAEFSQEPRLVEFYLSGEADLHSYATKIIYSDKYPEMKEMSLKEIKKNFPEERQLIKGFNFALAYGGSAITISINTGLPLDIVEAAEAEYFKAFPNLKAFFERVEKETIERGYILINDVTKRKSFFWDWGNMLHIRTQLEAKAAEFYNNLEFKATSKFRGLSKRFWSYRKRLKNSTKSDEMEKYEQLSKMFSQYSKALSRMERKGLNYPIQGTSADMTKIAGLRFYKWLKESGYWGIVKICLFVHDEIVVECPRHLAEDVKIQLKKAMEDAGKVFCKMIPITADPVITDFWTH